MFSGALLELAEELIRMGLSPSEVIEGYDLAMKKSLEILPSERKFIKIILRVL